MLSPKTLSPPSGSGSTFATSPNTAANVAVALNAGFLSLVPFLQSQAQPNSLDQTSESGRAVNYIAGLVVLGGAVKAASAHWHYWDVIIPGFTPFKADVPHGADAFVGGNGSSAFFGRGGYMNGNGNGTETEFDGPEYDGRVFANVNFANIIAQGRCTEDGSVGGPSTLLTKEQSISLNFREIVAHGQCSSLEFEEMPSSVVVDNADGDFTSSNVVKGFAAWFSGTYTSALVILASLATFFGLLSHRAPPIASTTWETIVPPSGSKQVLLGEVWFKRRLMYNIDAFIRNGCRPFPTGTTEHFEFEARPGNGVALYILQSLALASMWVAIKILGEKESIRIMEKNFDDYKVTDAVRRHLRYLLYPRAAVESENSCEGWRERMAKTARRRSQSRLDREPHGSRRRKGLRRTNIKIIVPGLALCAFVLFVWEDYVVGGGRVGGSGAGFWPA